MPDQPERAAETAAQGEAPQPERKQPPKKRRRKKSTLRLFLTLLLKLALIAAAVWALLNFVLGVAIHYGNNMYPALRDGDLIVAYRLQRPYLNAAVLYERGGEQSLARVIAMPGDVVEISETGALSVNGIAPAEEVFYPTYPAETGNVSYPLTVGEDQVFLLNDFRTDQTDSRSFGPVDLEDLIGPVLLTMRRRGF
ncbi:MAG: signal peptidase I [Oscillospiraceae bacterium]|nr:signal peptidase I [Oscillospiraceae bacterium]